MHAVNKLVNPFLSFQLYFENFLEKLAVDSFKMGADEYKHLRKEHTEDWIIDEFQKRSLEKGLATFNLRALRDALLGNQSISNRTHQEWQPPEVQGMFHWIFIPLQPSITNFNLTFEHITCP